MSQSAQSAQSALVAVRLRQIAKEIKAAQRSQRKALRAAATAVREQIKSELRITFKKIAADLKAAITESNSAIALRFRSEAEQAAEKKTLSTFIASRDVGRSDSVVEEPPVSLLTNTLKPSESMASVEMAAL